jgi:hypothetical protein
LIFFVQPVPNFVDHALVLQLHFDMVSIVGFSGVFVMADAPVDPMKKKHACLWFQQDGVGKEMADRIDGDAELG